MRKKSKLKFHRCEHIEDMSNKTEIKCNRKASHYTHIGFLCRKHAP